MRRWFNGYVVMQWFCAALGGSVGAMLAAVWDRPGWMVTASFVVSTVVVFWLGWALDRFFGTGRPDAEGKERSDP